MRRPLPRPEDHEVLRRRAALLARAPAAAADTGEPVVLLRLGETTVAAHLASLAGVTRLGPAAPMPGAPRWLHGLVAVQGRPVCAVDAAAALGLPREPGPLGVAALVARPGGVVAFAATGAEMVPAPGRAHPPPGDLAPGLARFALGVLPGGVVVLDLAALAAALEANTEPA